MRSIFLLIRGHVYRDKGQKCKNIDRSAKHKRVGINGNKHGGLWQFG